MLADPQEHFNLFGQPGTEATTREMSAKLDTFFQTYAAPQYDLWHGGRSKAKQVSAE